MRVCSVDQMRELDRRTIEEVGIPGIVLMEAAGTAIAEKVASLTGAAHCRIVVVSGGGNNGGDGFVASRRLLGMGLRPQTYLLADPNRVRGDAAANLSALQNVGGHCETTLEGQPLERLAELIRSLTRDDLVVDALLGTGLKDEPRGGLGTIIDAINKSEARCVAVDVPSGLDADSGLPLGCAVEATHTVTFAYPKLGLVGDPGIRYVGELSVVDIGIPPHLEGQLPFAGSTLDRQEVVRRIQTRPAHGHKGSFGHLLVVAGSPGKTGAALLCAEAALRNGAGLCTVAAPEACLSAIEAKTKEVMLVPAAYEDPENLVELTLGKAAVAIGPGIPTDNEAQAVVQCFVERCELPLVVDADGLNALAAGRHDHILRARRVDTVLTPHPGELSRLLGRPTAEIQRRRIETACEAAKRSQCHVALKGARTVVAGPEGDLFVNTTGNEGMGTAGSGDVLTGLIGALLAQGYGPTDATAVGVYLHGAAGDLAARRLGPRSLIAGDLIRHLPDVWMDLA